MRIIIIVSFDICMIGPEQAMARGGASAAATPLLPSAAGAPGTPRRNRFAFLCATLASMTTMLHGYSTLS